MSQTFYDLIVKTPSGEDKSLADYKGEVLLIVNVASRCGATPQYAGLESLYRDYKDQGFVVLGFPCNDFGAQEPGTNEEIQEFCSLNYDVTFDLFDKVRCLGADKAPLYDYLTTNAPQTGDIKWNFEKFLISRDGQIIARFETPVKPQDPTVISAIEQALAE